MASFVTLHTAFRPTQVNTFQAATLQPVARRTLSADTSDVKMISPVAVATSFQYSSTQTTINPALTHMLNPNLGFGIWLAGRRLPRSSFALPVLISPVGSATDQTLFEEPQDSNKKHYLSKYGIATQGSGSTLGRWVSFAPGPQGFVLTAHLADITDPAISSQSTRIDAPTTRYLLTSNIQGQFLSWDFNSVVADGTSLVLTLTVAPTDVGNRDAIYRAMTEPSSQAQLVIRRSFEVASPVSSDPPLYQQNDTAIDSPIAFTFDKDLDRNVFAGLTGVGTTQTTWNIQSVSWQQRPYPYYQNLGQPAQVYYLPDAFKISRQRAIPHTPSILISTNGDDPDSLSFTLSFLAVPVWDPNRLSLAAAQLQNTLALPSPPLFALFEASDTTLELTLPAPDPATAPGLTKQTNANIDIAVGIKCSVALSLAQFQQVYAALFDGISQLLSGVVTVTVGSDVQSIPFIASAADFAGDLFDVTESFDPSKSQFTYQLQNSIESTIHVESLPVVLTQAGQKIQNIVQQSSPSLPTDIVPPLSPSAGTAASASGSTPANILTVSLQLSPDQTIDQTCSALFDFGHTHVVPDPAAIWDAIMQNKVVGPVKRNITMTAFASIFGAAAAAASTGGSGSTASSSTTTPILALQVVFEGGQTVDFDPSTPVEAGVMKQTVSLAVPVKNYVLGVGDTSFYKYRVDQVSSSGTKQGNWISSNQDSFYVQVSG